MDNCLQDTGSVDDKVRDADAVNSLLPPYSTGELRERQMEVMRKMYEWGQSKEVQQHIIDCFNGKYDEPKETPRYPCEFLEPITI